MGGLEEAGQLGEDEDEDSDSQAEEEQEEAGQRDALETGKASMVFLAPTRKMSFPHR